MRKVLMIAAATCVLAGPALAEDVVVSPPRVGVTVDQAPPSTERKTVIKKDEPGSHTTVIKKDHDDGTRSKTVIHHDD